MKLWVDDVRPAPDDTYIEVHAVNTAKMLIQLNELGRFRAGEKVELIDIDHDAGEFAHNGGDYIKLLDWLEETGRNYPIRIHSMNPVGRENMRRIIQRNGWTEVG